MKGERKEGGRVKEGQEEWGVDVGNNGEQDNERNMHKHHSCEKVSTGVIYVIIVRLDTPISIWSSMYNL